MDQVRLPFHILCLSVGLNEPIGPEFCEGPHTTPWRIKIEKKFASNKILFLLNFENPRIKL